MLCRKRPDEEVVILIIEPSEDQEPVSVVKLETEFPFSLKTLTKEFLTGEDILGK